MKRPKPLGSQCNRMLLCAVIALLTSCAGADAGRVSSFGMYEGYSEARFEEWTTSSLYVEMRDGVRLAVDVVRPGVNGELVDEPFPVVWTHSNPTATFCG